MQHLPDLDWARRRNQAYETTYGSSAKVNDPIVRDMAADKVTERRSWFPAIKTAEWFTGPVYMLRYKNFDLTRGLDLKNRENFRSKARPGQIIEKAGYTTDLNTQPMAADGHKLLYLMMLVVGIVLLTSLFR